MNDAYSSDVRCGHEPLISSGQGVRQQAFFTGINRAGQLALNKELCFLLAGHFFNLDCLSQVAFVDIFFGPTILVTGLGFLHALLDRRQLVLL